MSLVFTPLQLGGIRLKNRFVFSACEDNLATTEGLVTDEVIRGNRKVAAGGTALIISGHMSVHPMGRTRVRQLGIWDDGMIPGLSRLVAAVHSEDCKIVFQLGHVGGHAGGSRSASPDSDPNSVDSLSESSIEQKIDAFGRAAGRAVRAGADGVQLHVAHGYLLNQFLSPYFNHRQDHWGGAQENCYRLIDKVIRLVKSVLPAGRALLVKLNANDYTDPEGITPASAAKYAQLMVKSGMDGLELSCGVSAISGWYMCRGQIPVEELLTLYSASRRPQVEARLRDMQASTSFVEAYNLEAAKLTRPLMGDVPLFAVGGWRNVRAMEDALENGHVDLISMCRPFIREPGIVRRILEGKSSGSACINCNRCLVAVATDMPVRCYRKGLPSRDKA